MKRAHGSRLRTPVLVLLSLPLLMAMQMRGRGDRDHDGIPDDVDKCPDQPETVNGFADNDGCPDSVNDLFQLARGSVDQFWREETPKLGVIYRPPTVVRGYTQEIQTPCGAAELDNAFFCGNDHGLYFDMNFLGDEFKRGDYAPVVIVAHEWGHLTQSNRGWQDSIPLRYELQADCYAGAYTRYAERQHMLEPGDMEEAISGLFRAGSTDVLWLDPQAHGSPGNRIDAFNWGYHNAAKACAEAVFMRKGGGIVPVWDVSTYPSGSLGDRVEPRVGSYTLVNVTRRKDLMVSDVTDAVQCVFRDAEGGEIWQEIVKLVSTERSELWISSNDSRLEQKGYTVIDQGRMVGKDKQPVGRWVQVQKADEKSIFLWTNGVWYATVAGAPARVSDFVKHYPF